MADITYTPLQWQDNNVASPYGGLSAARMAYIEAGIVAVTAQANTARSEGIAFSRLPTGSAGQVLTMVSGVPTWATPAGGGGGSPTGAAGGDLAGTYPNPTLRTTLQDPVAATAGLRTLGTGTQQALNAALADGRYLPQYPALMFPVGAAPWHVTASIAVNVANAVRCVRVVAPRTGTIRDMAVCIGTSSGNVEFGILDTSSTRNKLWSTGSIACPTASSTAWTIVGDPVLACNQGDQFDFFFGADNITATIRGTTGIASGAGQYQLPAGFNVVPGGAAPKMIGQIGASFPMPSTVSEASVSTATAIVSIIARIA